MRYEPVRRSSQALVFQPPALPPTRSAESDESTRRAMDVLVLAGGFGTRLRPLTEGRVKPLLSILDKTLLERVVEVVPSSMVDRVVVAAGYGIEEMRAWAAKTDLPYEVVLSVEEDALGTGGAIALAREHLSGEGAVLVLNGDLVSSVDVEALVEHHAATGASATLSLWEVEDPSRFGVCDLDSSGMIRRFQEKPAPGTEFSNLINAGCYLVERDVLESMGSHKHSMEREVFPGIAEAGRMAGLAFEGYFVDAGTPASFIEAAQVCIAASRFESGSRCCESWFGDSGRRASVTRSSIGAGVDLAEDCIVVDSVVMDGASVGSGANLTHCIIGEGASIGAGASLADAVIGHGSAA